MKLDFLRDHYTVENLKLPDFSDNAFDEFRKHNNDKLKIILNLDDIKNLGEFYLEKSSIINIYKNLKNEVFVLDNKNNLIPIEKN